MRSGIHPAMTRIDDDQRPFVGRTLSLRRHLRRLLRLQRRRRIDLSGEGLVIRFHKLDDEPRGNTVFRRKKLGFLHKRRLG
jgi:hypothetical protein